MRRTAPACVLTMPLVLVLFPLFLSAQAYSVPSLTIKLTPSPTSKLSVVVMDTGGAPLPDGFVRVSHWSRPTPESKHQMVDVASGYSDAKGGFSVVLPPGEYELYVSAPPFNPAVVIARILRGYDREYGFKLGLPTGNEMIGGKGE